MNHSASPNPAELDDAGDSLSDSLGDKLGDSLGTHHWQEMDRQHHMHPFTDGAALHTKGSRIITRAQGIYLWDSDGNQLLDGMAGLWCVNVGYGRPELSEAAARQMNRLPYYNNFFQTTHPPAVALARKLAELTPPHLNHAFFTNSGSECNDTVVRMVRHYWQVRGEPARQIIISRHNAYHGSTLASASLGGMGPMHAQGGIIPGVEHIMQPYWYRLGLHQSPEEFGRVAARALAERIEALGKHRVAAFIAEPIQGAGGVIVPPQTYWPEIARICERYGVLLVADEVICGFGRTGKWFATDYYGLKPDLMCLAKGLSSGYLPVGAVMVSDPIAGVLNESGGEFQHGFTYSGHPVACAVALENLRILDEEKIVERVENTVGPYFQRHLRALTHHPLVGEVRGVGLLGAIELVADKKAARRFTPESRVGLWCRERALDNGLVMRAVADSMVLSPPLIISPAQVDELMDKVRASLDQTLEHLRQGRILERESG